MNKPPRVNILYSEVLDEVFTNYFAGDNFKESSFFKKTDFGTIASKEELLSRRKILREEWAKVSTQIFDTLYAITGLTFQRNTIDVFLVRATPRTFSNPIIMYFKLDDARFLQTLVHELVHFLINDSLGKQKEVLNKILDRQFPSEDILTKVHIPVYAILGLLYEKVFPGENRMELEMKWASESKIGGYDTAIKIATNLGFKNIIDQIKDDFSFQQKTPLV